MIVMLDRVRRLDWLRLLWLGSLAGLVVTGIAAVVRVVEALLGGFTVPVPLKEAGEFTGTLPDGVAVDPSGWVPARIAEPTASQSLLHAATALPTLCVVAAALVLLERILRNTRRADPFTAANVRLLRLLGLTVVAGGVAADVVEALAARALAAPIVDGPVGGFFWSGWWLAGIAFLAVAEVFNRGVRMRAELDGLV